MKIILLFTAIAAACLAQVQIADGTKIRVRLESPISSATADEGQTVSFSVADPIKVGNTVVIPQSSGATGTVTLAQKKRRMGRSGKLDFSIDRVRAVDGQWIPVRYTQTKKEGGNRTMASGVTTGILAVAFWPAAPFALLMQGKDATVPKGAMFEVFTDDTHLVMNTTATSPNMNSQLVDREMAIAAGFAPVTPASGSTGGQPGPAPAASAGVASVTILTSTPGAEIEVDGIFVGSTPSTLQLPAGVHRVTVKSGGQSWDRSVQFSPGGSITLNAVLEAPADQEEPRAQRTKATRRR
ncbi:MAG: PEGA domain-containing protein [Acidobacteria bacterium]|nr:PEGA domain-containing protein [Acidobacteriota bacterium]